MSTENEQKAIEAAFVESWDWVENFYKTQGTFTSQWIGAFPHLIHELRKRNYDQKLRAGTQLLTFILSRSKKDGLRAGQAGLRFEGKKEGGMKIQYWEHPDTRIEFEVASVEITPEIEALLERLLAQPID